LIFFKKSANLAITLCVDASIQGNARYNPQNSTMTFQNDYVLGDDRTFAEEFYHAFQNFIYPGGTAQYLGNADGNLEFEYQLQKDINYGGANTEFFDRKVFVEYNAWLKEVTHDFTFKPTIMRDLTISGHKSYFYFVEKYAQQRQVPFSSTLKPLSLFHTSLNVPNTCN
jgi:hypothetical protein